MSSNLPTQAQLDGASTPFNQGVYKTAIGALRNFVADLFGTTTAVLRDVWEAFRLNGPETLANLSIVPSVASNALTLTLKTRAQGTLSAVDAAMVAVRNSVAGTGDSFLRAVTGALSLVVSSGSTLGHTSGEPNWIYLYLVDSDAAGAIKLAVSSVFLGHSFIGTTVAEGGAGAADSATMLYSNAAYAGKAVRYVGRMLSTQAAAGTWLTLPSRIELLPNMPHAPVGQCRLVKSGANLLLTPLLGNKLTQNGRDRTVPAAGLTLAPTSATPGTNYYIYASDSDDDGIMDTLERQATGHATDPLTGEEHMTGDPNKILVGYARAVTGPAWADSATQRFVISWFNRCDIASGNHFTATRTTASTSFVELNSEIRCEFLTWAAEAVRFGASGSWYHTTGGGNGVRSSIGFDGTTAEDVSCLIYPTLTDAFPFAIVPASVHLAEGYHYATLLGSVSSGTGGWYVASNANGLRTAMAGTIRG